MRVLVQRFDAETADEDENKSKITEIFSVVILYLLLIQKGQLSVSGERMCTILDSSED